MDSKRGAAFTFRRPPNVGQKPATAALRHHAVFCHLSTIHGRNLNKSGVVVRFGLITAA
jgi:hypothetical protein